MSIHELFGPKPKPVQSNGSKPPPTASEGEASDTTYGLKAITAMADEIAVATEGGRDTLFNTLCLKAGVLVRDGRITRDTAESFLRDAAMTVSDASFHPAQIEEKLHRVITEGMHSDYVVTPREAREEPSFEGDWRQGEHAPSEEPPTRTSWWPRDIGPIVRGEADPEPPPTLLTRADGQALFYPGKLNGLIGESESGKTWVALLGVAQELEAGRRVTYIDCEDSAPGIVSRLRMLGVTDEALGLLAYVGPDDALGPQASRDLFEHLAAHQPSLIVLDGYNAAMTMLGLNLLDNMDIYKFALMLLRPLKNTGAAVIFVDHVTKSKENRGSYAIGGQAKRADVDGCALNVEVLVPFGKGMAGKLKLTVSKDRAGYVRGASAGAKNAGTVLLDSSEDGSFIALSIEAPERREAGKPFRPTMLMQKVSHFLATTEGALSQVQVVKGVTGNESAIKDALARLVEEGFATRSAGSRSAIMYSHVRPFYEASDGLNDPFTA